MTTAQTAFGHRLREARERRGLSIDAISQSTKINGALFAELERGEPKRWPAGIFRRAFFREYSGAIGLDPEPLLPDFLRLFPEDLSIPADTVVRAESPRMTLAAGRTWTTAAASRRAATAVAELGCVVAAGSVAASYGMGGIWTASGVAAIVYWTASTAIVGRGALAWWVERQALGVTSRPAAARRLRIVPRQVASLTLEAPPEQDVSGLRAASR